MSKTGDLMMWFLEGGGYELGYHEREMPDLKDIDFVIEENIPIWEYRGKTEKQYYGGE